MKTKLLAILILVVIAIGLYLALKPHPQNPHYYAAACVMINDIGQPKNPDEFMAKLQAVIVNENASYAFDKVEFDRHSAQGASQRYYALSPAQQADTRKGLDNCLAVMLPAARP
jgi:surface antigen